MAIRIMHVVDSMVVGGLQNGLVNVIDRLDADRFEHVVCAVRHLGAMAKRLPSDRVRTLCLDAENSKVRVQVGSLAQCISKFKPDIVHSRNWGAIEAVIAGRWSRQCAVIHSEHGLEKDQEPWRRQVFRRIAYALADRVFTVSFHLKTLLVEKTGVPAARIGVIHNGVDTRRFCPDPQSRLAARQRLGIAETEFCIGAVGRLDPIKDYITLLRAAEQLNGVPWRILFVGHGPDSSRLQEFVAARAGWSDRVLFGGDSDEVPELLRAMDVYVLPSILEGIANSLLEAMASGLPVVVSQTGGNPEVVSDGESGLLFPVGEPNELASRLQLLYANPEVCHRLSERAMCRVKQEFSMESMARCYTDLYEGVLRARQDGVRSQ